MLNEKFLLFRVYHFRDKAAYTKLYNVYHGKILDFTSFKVPRKQEAEEVASEVFLRGWEYATSNKVENIKALFYRIARNLIADFYRKRKLESSIDEMGEIPHYQGIEEGIDFSEEVRSLIIKMNALKGDMKDVCIMRHVNEMSIKEIADILDKSSNHIRVILHRGNKVLREP